MKLSELIAKYGDEEVKFQNLDGCVKNMNYRAGKGTTITFGTDVLLNSTLDGLAELGLVVWLDREKVEKILKENKP